MVILLAVYINILRNILNQIAFHAINDLLIKLAGQILNLRECLNNPMIGNRDGRMMPCRRGLNHLLQVDKTIQAHLSVQMQFHSGLRIIILMTDFFQRTLFHLPDVQNITSGIFIKAHIAADPNRHAVRLFHNLYQACGVIGAIIEFFAVDSVGIIGKFHGENQAVIPKFSEF